ncbi:MAG: sulfotransferase [Acidimicrobiia bacterium]
MIGAMKGGTTSLYEYLRAHPQIFMPKTKELNYFAAARNWDRGAAWYEAQFADSGDALAVGEASPTYAMDPNHPGVPARIAEVLPDVKLIYLVRHPVLRIESHYRHRVRYEGETRGPDDAVLGHLGVYLPPSQYAHQMDCYLARFPREQLLVVRSEDLRDDRRATLRRVLGFLGVDDGHFPETAESEFLQNPPRARSRRVLRFRRGPRTHGGTGALSPESRADIIELLRPDTRRLREHLGPEFDAWGIE